MPVNKNAQLRYKVLDRCFRNKGRNFGINDLINEINKELEDLYGQDVQVSRRTVYDDIKYMKSDQGYSIPLKPYRDGQKVYMRYEDTNFSIYNQKLTDIEKRIILNATDVISRASGLQPFEDFQDILPKLKDAIDIKTTSQISISFEANLDLKGKEYFKIISEEINKKQVLDINYKDFKSEKPYKIIFHPYYLKQYNNRWFAFGLNETTQISTWNVPLDRIEKIDYVNTKYIPSDIDWYEYFYDIIGVTRLGKQVEKVVLKFTKEQAPYIETKPLHPTQKLDWVGDSLIAKIEVIPNYELETLILSFGEKVEVLEPKTLINKIRFRTFSMYNTYNLSRLNE